MCWLTVFWSHKKTCMIFYSSRNLPGILFYLHPLLQALVARRSLVLSHRIEFWDCPSNAEWSLHQMVHNNVTNTRVAAGLHPAISLDILHSKSVLSCLDAWRTAFNHPTVQGCHFLTLRDKKCKSLQPSYSKGSSWLTHIG